MIVTCRDVTEAATAKKEGALGALDRSALMVHLAWCSRCRTYLSQMDVTVEALRALPKQAAPEAIHTALLEKFGRRRKPPA